MPINYADIECTEVEIHLPASKSISNRALLIQALSQNDISLENISTAADTVLMQSLLQNKSLRKNAGISGTVARFICAYLATQQSTFILDADERMRERPMKDLFLALESLGANMQYLEKEYQLPVSINGAATKGGAVKISGKTSSQFISALMMIAPYLKNGLNIQVTDAISSQPYIEMTAKVMQHFNANVSIAGKQIKISEGTYAKGSLVIENDWSSASYFYSALALMDEGSILLKNLNFISWQGDSVLAEIYYRLGIISSRKEDDVLLEKSENIIDFLEYNFEDCPDLAQSVICTCIGLGLEGRFTGLHTLRNKETDRILALQNELQKFNWELIEETPDTFDLKRKQEPSNQSLEIETYNDHRMAMAFAPLSVIYGEMSIKNMEVVQKSFPSFWEEFKKIGIH